MNDRTPTNRTPNDSSHPRHPRRAAVIATVALAATFGLVAACSSGSSTSTTATGASTAGTSATAATSNAPATSGSDHDHGADGTTPGQVDGTYVTDDGVITIPAENVGALDLRALPLGTGLTSSTPSRDHLMLCRGANASGNQTSTEPWVDTEAGTFDLLAKVWVQGAVAWPDAYFHDDVSGGDRTLAGNDLPVDETTGIWPAADDDPAGAARYRPSPLPVEPRTYSFTLPAEPTTAASASCVGGEVGIATDGVAIFNAVDADGKDAVAEEVQDSCGGHTNGIGYHYHSLPFCMDDGGTGHSPLIGYAFDGFGIYGPRGDDGVALTNADLDECHGTTDTVTWNGQQVRMYHYVANLEFPYTVGCYRGTPAYGSSQGPAFGTAGLPGR